MARYTQALLARLHRMQAGEGVISAAIVVLIMALLGAAMWAAFNGIFTSATTEIQNTVDSIGG
jgi:ABC-type Na+ efflux pump permease subunit